MPPNLCCTCDFNGDGILGVEDYKLYKLWVEFVNKSLPEAMQKAQLELFWMLFFPGEAPVTVTDLPTLDCSDFNGDSILGPVDYRFYKLWVEFVDKADPEAVQLTTMETFWQLLFPWEAAEDAVRRPILLDPANCDVLHGWFVTPWHGTVTIGGEVYGWLE